MSIDKALSIAGIYCGMHSLADCVAGSLLGTAIWYGYLLISPLYEDFVNSKGYTGNLFVTYSSLTPTDSLGVSALAPAVIIPSLFTIISLHPQPVDDCPCFEDAIAFLAVAAGIALGQWGSPAILFIPAHTLGSLDSTDVRSTALWAGTALVKIVVGVAAIFAWRLLAKNALQTALPPIFRAVEPFFSLPRRFYTSAR